jgi:hypothetical protein
MTIQPSSSEGEAAKQARLEYDKLEEEIERRRLNIEDQQLKLQRQAEELQRQIDLVAQTEQNSSSSKLAASQIMNTGAGQRENGYDETAGSEESQYEDDEDEEDGEVVVPPAQVDKRREEGEVVPKKLERGRSPKLELSPMKK